MVTKSFEVILTGFSGKLIQIHAIAPQVSWIHLMDSFYLICSLIISYSLYSKAGDSNYADDNNLCSERKDINLVKDRLHKDYN